jgi:hypothetical protein
VSPEAWLHPSLAALEVVALDHDPARRRHPLDLLEPWHRIARPLGDPEGERGRIVLAGMPCSAM